MIQSLLKTAASFFALSDRVELPKKLRGCASQGPGSRPIKTNTLVMQNDSFRSQGFNTTCPSCGHRLFLHGFGHCAEMVGRLNMQYVENGFIVAIPGCGCTALVCDCQHPLYDHGGKECLHRAHDIYDQGERDCGCKRSNLDIWDAAVATQQLGEHRAVAHRALESLHKTLCHEPKMVELIADAVRVAEDDGANKLLLYIDVVRKVESEKGRDDSAGALEALRGYGLILARISGGPDIGGEPAVVRGLRLAGN